jgi:hypothetical protein
MASAVMVKRVLPLSLLYANLSYYRGIGKESVRVRARAMSHSLSLRTRISKILKCWLFLVHAAKNKKVGRSLPAKHSSVFDSTAKKIQY